MKLESDEKELAALLEELGSLKVTKLTSFSSALSINLSKLEYFGFAEYRENGFRHLEI